MITYSTKTLGSFVSWTRVLPALGLHVPVATLPAQLTCPLCEGNSLRILNDAALGGQWHYCDDCQSCGDLIELAAKTWKLSLSATIEKLQDLSATEFPDTRVDEAGLQQYRRQVDYRRRFRDNWETFKRNLRKPQKTLTLLSARIGIQSDLSSERRKIGPGEIIGGGGHEDIEKLYHQYTAAVKNDGRRNPSAWRVLRGLGWSQCLVIPYWDMPGRIGGMLFIGRKGERAQGDWTFKVTDLSRHSTVGTPAVRDSGLAMHPRTSYAAKDWGCVVGVSNPLLLVRLQQRHFRTDDHPLPLVAWHHDENSRSLAAWRQNFPGRRVVLWEQEVTPQLIMQAINANAEISLLGPDASGGQSLLSWSCRGSTQSLLKLVVKQARPWQEVVGKWLHKARSEQIEELFHFFNRHKVPTEQLLRTCAPQNVQRIRQLLKPLENYRTVMVGRQLVSEQDGGWFVTTRGGSAAIADAILRVDRVIHQRKQGRTYYQGRILYRDQSYDFCEKKEAVERNTPHWMQQRLLEAGAGLMQYDRTWQRHMLNVALQLQPPEFVYASDVVGWNPETMTFVFPKFTLDACGEIGPTAFAMTSPNLPCADFVEPSTLTPAELDDLTENSVSNTSAWALCLATLVNVLSPIFGQRPCGLLLGGQGVSTLARDLHRALGWQYAVGVKHATFEQTHHWPTLFAASMANVSASWLLNLEDQAGVVTGIPWVQAAAVYLRGGWTLAEGEVVVNTPPGFLRHGARLLVNYLQDLAARRFQTAERSWPLDVVHDVAEWLEKQNADGGVVFDAVRRLKWDTSREQADTLGDLLAKLQADNKLDMRKEGYAGKIKPTTILLDNGQVFLPKKAYAMLGYRAALLDTTFVSRLLAEAGVLIGEDKYLHDDGWLVPAEWWTQRLHRWRMAGSLRIHRSG